MIRAVFVPDGAEPPPEFAGQFHQLRMRATYDPATGKLTCASPGTHFGGDIRAEWHPDEVPGSKQGGGSTGSDSSARGIGQSSAESSAGSRSDPDRRAAASSAPEEGRSDPDNQVGSWLDRYRPPSTSRFGVTPFTGQAWLGNAAAKPVSPSRVFPQAGGKIASDASMADSEAAAPLNTGSTVPPTASAQDTPTPAEPLERNLYAYVGNDPTNSVDPSGLSSEGKLDGGGSFQTAQLAPAGPVPLPLPPVFLPGTLENNDFVNSTIRAGKAITGAIGDILNTEQSDESPGQTPSAGNLKPASKGDLQAAAEADGYATIEEWKQQELQLDSRSNLVKDAAGNLYSVPTLGGGSPQPLGVKLPR